MAKEKVLLALSNGKVIELGAHVKQFEAWKQVVTGIAKAAQAVGPAKAEVTVRLAVKGVTVVRAEYTGPATNATIAWDEDGQVHGEYRTTRAGAGRKSKRVDIEALLS